MRFDRTDAEYLRDRFGKPGLLPLEPGDLVLVLDTQSGDLEVRDYGWWGYVHRPDPDSDGEISLVYWNAGADTRGYALPGRCYRPAQLIGSLIRFEHPDAEGVEMEGEIEQVQTEGVSPDNGPMSLLVRVFGNQLMAVPWCVVSAIHHGGGWWDL